MARKLELLPRQRQADQWEVSLARSKFWRSLTNRANYTNRTERIPEIIELDENIVRGWARADLGITCSTVRGWARVTLSITHSTNSCKYNRMTNQLPISFAIPNLAGNKAYSDYKPDNQILTLLTTLNRNTSTSSLGYSHIWKQWRFKWTLRTRKYKNRMKQC